LRQRLQSAQGFIRYCIVNTPRALRTHARTHRAPLYTQLIRRNEVKRRVKIPIHLAGAPQQQLPVCRRRLRLGGLNTAAIRAESAAERSGCHRSHSKTTRSVVSERLCTSWRNESSNNNGLPSGSYCRVSPPTVISQWPSVPISKGSCMRSLAFERPWCGLIDLPAVRMEK
jgi:hypothetical protein